MDALNSNEYLKAGATKFRNASPEDDTDIGISPHLFLLPLSDIANGCDFAVVEVGINGFSVHIHPHDDAIAHTTSPLYCERGGLYWKGNGG
jgi:hypothetical protein